MINKKKKAKALLLGKVFIVALKNWKKTLKTHFVMNSTSQREFSSLH